MPFPSGIQKIRAGLNITVTKPTGPDTTIAAPGGGGGVDSVVAGSGINVDDTDPANPVVSSTAVESVVAGTGISVDDTDPLNPVVNAEGGGGGIASLSGEGVDTSPGLLDQAGGLAITDSEADGIVFSTNGTFSLTQEGSGVGGISLNDEGGDGLDLNSTGEVEIIAGTNLALASGPPGTGAIMLNGVSYFTGNGSPVGVITPNSSGDIYTDASNGAPNYWIANGGSDTDWLPFVIGAATDSHTATTEFGAVAVGTPIQNTLGFEVLVNVSIPVTAVSGGSVAAGVGPSATPTTDPVSPTLVLGVGASSIVSFSCLVPANYYLSVVAVGTITLGTPVVLVTAV